MHHDEIRALLADVQSQMTLIAASAATDRAKGESAKLATAWAALEKHLAVEPRPATRMCPKCGKEIVKAATLCGHCWAKSPAPGAHEARS